MFYYHVFVNDSSYQANTALTYADSRQLHVGSFVRVTVKKKSVLGFITKRVSKPKFSTKQIEEVLDIPSLPIPSIELAKWLLYYYPSSVGFTSSQFMPKAISAKDMLENDTAPQSLATSTLPSLTSEQKVVLGTIDPRVGIYMIHGETGSGKTRVYIELARRALSQNRSAIILTPEIGLTPQLANSFREAFGDTTVVVTHSKLTDKQRIRLWLKMLHAAKPCIVVGPRSALFSPLNNVGLIVIDECHEQSYKQEQAPHYIASRVAAKLAELQGSVLVMGSATPSVSDYYLLEQKNKPILRMTKLARSSLASAPTKIELVDMKDRSRFSKSSCLSDDMLHVLERSLQMREQSLLFLNRRGTARSTVCNHCGWQALCPNCNLPLTYHADVHLLRCHTCGFRQQALSSCPACGNTDIILKNIGTKFIVDEITTLFPNARVLRFDADNKKADSLEQKYDAVRSGEADILIGTQILAKGLDLPKLTTVGIINADTGLYFPDYTAGERTYQLLRQVIGRVGRGHKSNSSVIVQSYDPQNIILQAAIKSDWQSFYSSQLEERKKFLFPPFCFLLKLTCRRANTAAAEKAATRFAEKLAHTGQRILIDGPSPSFHEKIGNKYQWQLVVKAKQRSELLKVITLLPSGWAYDIDPLNLL